MIEIDKIVAVRLVVCAMDLAPDLRQDHHIQIFVFKNQRLIRRILFLIGDLLRYGKRIHFARTALIGALFNEERTLFRRAGLICGNHDRGFRYFDLIHIV